MKFRKKLYLMFQIGCIMALPVLLVFFTAFEMWKHLIKFSIYMAIGFFLNHFEIIETLKWRWDRETKKKE